MRYTILWNTILVLIFVAHRTWTTEGGNRIQGLHHPTTKSHQLMLAHNVTSTQGMIPLGNRGALNESFEDGSIPMNWTVYDNDDNSDQWEALEDADFAHTGSFSAYVGHNTYGNDDWLITPQLDVTSSNHTFSFWARSYDPVLLEDFDVKLSTTGNEIDNFTEILDEVRGVPDSYTQYTYDLSDYIGQRVYIAIVSVSVNKYSLYVDDVTGPDVYIPPDPEFAITPDSAGFDEVPLGDTSDVQTFTIYNSGGGTLTLNWVQITGDESDQFILDDANDYPVDLGYYESITVDVYFAPNSEGEKQAELTIEEDDGNGGVYHDYPLTGSGYEANYGGGNEEQGGYYFANSLATNAPSHPSFDWIDISGTGTEITDQLDDETVYGPLDIGFTFNFFGTDYTELYVSSNGWVSFDSPSSAYPLNDSIPCESGLQNHIALFWTDLNPDNPNVSGVHCYVGNSPEGDFVLTLEHYPQRSANSGGWITCQLILKQNGNIKMQYLDHGEYLETDGCTVGLENDDGTTGVQYRYNDWGGPLFGSPLAVEFGQDDQSLPVELVHFSASVSSGQIVLDWNTQSETDNMGFEIYRSTDPEKGYQCIASYHNSPSLVGAGNSNMAHQYRYVDGHIRKEIIYYYRLADVTFNGVRHFHGPVTAMVPTTGGSSLKYSSNNPRTFALKRNFPNPFNPTTTIGFDIPQIAEGPMSVQLIVFNTLGQRVRTLVDGILAAGSYTITWDGRNDVGEPVANGIYFYGLKAGGFTQFHKMMLMK